MFDDLDAALKEFAATDLAELSGEELDEAVVAMSSRRARTEAIEVELLRAWEARKSWRADGSRSAAAWLARRSRSPREECGRRLWLSKVLLHMPLVAEALVEMARRSARPAAGAAPKPLFSAVTGLRSYEWLCPRRPLGARCPPPSDRRAPEPHLLDR